MKPGDKYTPKYGESELFNMANDLALATAECERAIELIRHRAQYEVGQ